MWDMYPENCLRTRIDMKFFVRELNLEICTSILDTSCSLVRILYFPVQKDE
jgi:hypothetical protein